MRNRAKELAANIIICGYDHDGYGECCTATAKAIESALRQYGREVAAEMAKAAAIEAVASGASGAVARDIVLGLRDRVNEILGGDDA